MTTPSNDQLFESLSALVDNEASELEVRRILKQVEQNPELLQRWRSYHLIGSALRKEKSGTLSTTSLNLAASVSHAIFNEDAYIASQAVSVGSQTNKPWRGLLGKSFVAASVAVVTLVGLGSLNTLPTDQVALVAQNAPVVTSPIQSSMAPVHAPEGFNFPSPEGRTAGAYLGGESNIHPISNAQTVSFQPVNDLNDVETQRLLNSMLLDHIEKSSVNGSLGLMPFARVMSSGQLRD